MFIKLFIAPAVKCFIYQLLMKLDGKTPTLFRLVNASSLSWNMNLHSQNKKQNTFNWYAVPWVGLLAKRESVNCIWYTIPNTIKHCIIAYIRFNNHIANWMTPIIYSRLSTYNITATRAGARLVYYISGRGGIDLLASNRTCAIL